MATLDHPYGFAGDGRTAVTDSIDHIRDLIEQVLFTSPGERVMRPDFGAGLLAMVFEPNSEAMADTAQFLLRSGLQRDLGDLIAVDAVSIDNIDSALQVTVRYRVLSTGAVQESAFALPRGNP